MGVRAIAQGSSLSSVAKKLRRRKFESQREARIVVFQCVEGWYIPRRRHSATDYNSREEYLAAAGRRKPNRLHETGSTPHSVDAIVDADFKRRICWPAIGAAQVVENCRYA